MGKRKWGIKDRMGAARWQESWGSNIAVGAGLLTTFASSTVLPDHTRLLPRGGYLFLALLFAAIVALAPVIYGVCRVPVLAPGKNGTEVKYEGFAGVFLGAACLSLWGAFGQLGTIGFVLGELQIAHILTPSALAILALLVCVLALLLAGYGVVSIRQLLDGVTSPAAEGTRPPAPTVEWARPQSAGGRALPEWPLL